MMTERKEKLLDRMIRLYGHENSYVIAFAKACETDMFSEDVLEVAVTASEEYFKREGVENNE